MYREMLGFERDVVERCLNYMGILNSHPGIQQANVSCSFYLGKVDIKSMPPPGWRQAFVRRRYYFASLVYAIKVFALYG